MGIRDYKPETVVVQTGNTSLTLRGVSLEDISVLMGNHLDDLDAVIAIFGKSVKSDIDVALATQYVVGLIREAPALCSSLIALADVDNEDDDAEPYRVLGLGHQLKCIEAIGQLTFKEAGGPKKLLESLTGLILNVSPPQSQTGSRTLPKRK